jgi:hypothetical protein
MIESKPQNSIEELKARNIELTIQKSRAVAKHKVEIAAQKLNLFVIYPRLGIILLIVMVK